VKPRVRQCVETGWLASTTQLEREDERILNMCGIDPQRPGAHCTGVLGGIRGASSASLFGG
jgi:hypothetical protein